MKKILLIGAIISSIAFANSSMMHKGNSTVTATNMSMASTTKNVTLTEAQQKELDKIKDSCKKAMASLKLTVEEKDLAVKKELLNDKPDWSKIEGILKEKANVNAQIELIMIKSHNEIQTKFGITDSCSHMDMSNGMKMHNKMKM
jgi:Spy/CpxP family protein refolding chaperone